MGVRWIFRDVDDMGIGCLHAVASVGKAVLTNDSIHLITLLEGDKAVQDVLGTCAASFVLRFSFTNSEELNRTSTEVLLEDLGIVAVVYRP